MEAKRKKISPSLENRLKQFYGGKICVVTGTKEDDGVSIEWAHLDEDPSHTTFENIIPLSSGFNITEESWKRNKERGIKWFDRTIDLKANFLFPKMERHFRLGFPALAYGCSRLGQVLSMKYPKDFEADGGDVWAFFCQSLYYLPYKMDCDLLISVLQDLNKFLNYNSNCPGDLQPGLLLALANLYQDGGLWRDADEIYTKLEKLKNVPQTVKACSHRRRAIGSIFSRTGAYESEYGFDQAYDLNQDYDFQTSVTIARAWKDLVNQSPKLVLSKLEEYNKIFKNPKRDPIEILNPHNVFELAFTLSAAKLKLGINYRDQINIVNRLHIEAPYTRLRPVFTDHISVLAFDEQMTPPISSLSMKLIFTPNLLSLMAEVTNKILIMEPNCSSVRRPWVD